MSYYFKNTSIVNVIKLHTFSIILWEQDPYVVLKIIVRPCSATGMGNTKGIGL